MQQLREPILPAVLDARTTTERVLKQHAFSVVDAASRTTGRDFLLKVWELAVSCPVGIALVHEGIAADTLANIYYELGLMQAYGRETVVVRIGRPELPSDFVRTEYIDAGSHLERQLASLLDDLRERAEYYEKMAEQLENNPLLSIDYFRRAFLLTNDKTHRERARAIFAEYDLGRRARSSVERMAISF
jgi:hypothetical protein